MNTCSLFESVAIILLIVLLRYFECELCDIVFSISHCIATTMVYFHFLSIFRPFLDTIRWGLFYCRFATIEFYWQFCAKRPCIVTSLSGFCSARMTLITRKLAFQVDVLAQFDLWRFNLWYETKVRMVYKSLF